MRSFALLSLLFICSISFAQRKIIFDLEKDKYGVYDFDNHILTIPEMYDDLKRFFPSDVFYYKNSSYDFYLAKLNGKWGLIDKSNNIILPIQYDKIGPIYQFTYQKPDSRFLKFGEKIRPNGNYLYQLKRSFLAFKDRKPQLITPEGIFDLPKGNYQNPISYSNYDGTKSQILIMENNGNYGVISMNGKILVPFEYDNIRCYHNTMSEINQQDKERIEDNLRKRNKQSILNTGNKRKGTLPSYLSSHFIDPSFEKDINLQHPKLQLSDFSPNKFSLIKNIKQSHEKKKIPKKYQSIESIYGKKIIAQKNGKWNLIDVHTNQKILTDCDFIEKAKSSYHDDPVKVSQKGMVGILNARNSKWLVSPKYEDVNYLHTTFSLIKKNGKWGAIGKNEKVLIPIDYDEIKNRYQVRKGEYWGIIDKDQNWLLLPKYDKLSGGMNGAHIYKNGKVGYFSHKNQIFIEPIYQEIYSTRIKGGSIFFAKKNDKWGIIDKLNKIIKPFESDKLNRFDNQIVACKNELCALIDKKGKEITPYIFTSIKRYERGRENLLRVEQEQKYGIIDTLGNWVLPCEFDWAGPSFSNNLKERLQLIPVKKDKKVGFAKEGGEIIIPYKYDRVSYLSLIHISEPTRPY